VLYGTVSFQEKIVGFCFFVTIYSKIFYLLTGRYM
jgi:hypothetical protein